MKEKNDLPAKSAKIWLSAISGKESEHPLSTETNSRGRTSLNLDGMRNADLEKSVEDLQIGVK
ncbi:hypothetical protein [Brucella pituitosa]|uniref:hypothetical protein n=1 Tax=Brucella pituitosa TaxID=571256 RepID=UPI0012601733|nr:hypothetical protein [Brucella pituitosa]